MTERSIQVHNSTEYHHVKWIELKPGQLVECAVMKEDEFGNLYFFPLADLDDIDKRRFFSIITSRHAPNMALWDLMSQKSLGNGMNALNYFHQLVKIVTPDGNVINPRAGVIGGTAGRQNVAGTAEANPAADNAE